jgi:hypothetical protein
MVFLSFTFFFISLYFTCFIFVPFLYHFFHYFFQVVLKDFFLFIIERIGVPYAF